MTIFNKILHDDASRPPGPRQPINFTITEIQDGDRSLYLKIKKNDISKMVGPISAEVGVLVQNGLPYHENYTNTKIGNKTANLNINALLR